MLNKIIKLILDIRSQDLIADVLALENEFNIAIAQVKALDSQQQAEIISAAHAIAVNEYKISSVAWQSISDVEKCFAHLAQLHKIERAKDAGAKILHAMHKVLTLQTTEEFAAFSLKYATNHDKHAQDANGHDAFAAALKIAEINQLLTTKSAEMAAWFATYNTAATALQNDFGESHPDIDAANAIDAAQKVLAAILRAGALEANNPVRLKTAFDALANLQQAKNNLNLAAVQANVAAQLAAKRDEAAAADEAVRNIIAAFTNFTAFADKAETNSGFIAGLIGPLGELQTIITEQMDTVEENLQPDVITRVKAEVNLMRAGTVNATLVNELRIAPGAALDVVAGSINTEKGKQRAQSAGEAILAKFKEVNAELAEFDAAEAISLYANNHNMHALNVLENTEENSELREIMFTAMQGLPFPAAIVRDLTALQSKFVELVEARQVN